MSDTVSKYFEDLEDKEFWEAKKNNPELPKKSFLSFIKSFFKHFKFRQL